MDKGKNQIVLKNCLAGYLSNHKWIIARIMLQTFEELYLHTSNNCIRFDAPFIEVSYKREQGNWMERAYNLSRDYVGVLLIEINCYIQCKVRKLGDNFYYLCCKNCLVVQIKPRYGIIRVDIVNYKNSKVVGPQWSYIWNFAGKKLNYHAARENIFRNQNNRFIELHVLRPCAM